MKIIDSFMYFDEDMILDIRLNTLDKFVSKFIICEAKFNHNGVKKDLKFNINNFKKFEKKIEYLVLENQPQNLFEINENDSPDLQNSKILDNALIRENYQRNFCYQKIKNFSEEDLIIINDLDEIPNLENFEYKNKINIFMQKMFYYKLNLKYPKFDWMGSRICKIKHLRSPQWLRNIKPKRYPIWRLDTFLSKRKYNNIQFIKDGGWHFTNVKNAKDLDHKMRNFLHHLEYEKSGLSSIDLDNLIKNKLIMYDHNTDKKDQSKWKSSKKLEKVELFELPSFIEKNFSNYREWLD